MMTRAATDEVVNHGAMRGIVATIPARSPADDFDLVIVTLAYNVTSGISQAAHNIEVTGRRRPVHGGGIVSLFASVHVKATVQQQIHHGKLAVVCGEVQ